MKGFIARSKQRSGYEYARANGRRLWQPSYCDHVLREDEGTVSVIAYILSNPVRAGLVERVEDYPFVGFPASSTEEMLGLLTQTAPQWIPELARASTRIIK